MNFSTWQLAKQIFDEAREISLEDRRVFLDTKCAGNSELRSEVESFWAHTTAAFWKIRRSVPWKSWVNPTLPRGK